MSNKRKIPKSAIINRKTIRITYPETNYIILKTLERLKWLLVSTKCSPTKEKCNKVLFTIRKSGSIILIETNIGNNEVITVSFGVLEIGSGALKYPTTQNRVIERFWRIFDRVLLSEIRELQ